MTSVFSLVTAYINYATQLRGFLRTTETPQSILEHARRDVTNREDHFLATLQRNVYSYPRSPYLQMLRAKGITRDDIVRWMGQQGLEATLEQLLDEGIYVTFEELKGRAPIRRDYLELDTVAEDFDNPSVRPALYGASGGSTGVPTRHKMDIDHILSNGRHTLLTYVTHDLWDAPAASWRGLLPDSGCITLLLRQHLTGRPMERWFSPLRWAQAPPKWYNTLMSRVSVTMMNVYGAQAPYPEYLPHENPLPLVQWAAGAVQREGKALVRASVSKAVRASICAQDNGISLAGVTFMGGGEPVTKAKSAAIEASGARHIPYYTFNEGGAIGLACAHASTHDDLHFNAARYALILQPTTVFDETVEAFCLTSLLDNPPRMLINAQSDDFGEVVHRRGCGCPLDEVGLHTHLYTVRSYRKLTGEGMTLLGSDATRILEHDLPVQFGGGPLDYQLVEEETSAGITRLFLYVHPRLPLSEGDEAALADAF